MSSSYQEGVVWYCRIMSSSYQEGVVWYCRIMSSSYQEGVVWYCRIMSSSYQEGVRLPAEKGPAPPPPLGNFADIVYLKEQSFLIQMRDVCTLYAGA